MTCTMTQRERLREARRALLAYPHVFGAALLAPAEGPRDRWTVELALGPDVDGFDSELQLVAYQHGLTLLAVESRSPTETRVVAGLESRA